MTHLLGNPACVEKLKNSKLEDENARYLCILNTRLSHIVRALVVNVDKMYIKIM